MDEIQRKLNIIDAQLTGGVANFHKKVISTAPLLFVAVGLITGIVIQNTFSLSILVWIILLAPFSAATILFFAIQQRSSSTNYQSPVTNYQYAAAYLAFVCFVCLGAVRLTGFYQPGPNDIRSFVGNERKLATIRGRIITEPYVNKNKHWEFAKFTPRDPASSFYLKLNEVKTAAGWAKAAGTVRVQVAEPVLDLKTGDYIQAYCWLGRFKQATNPGQFDIAKYLARKNIFIAANVKSRDSIEILRPAQNDKWSGIFTKTKRKLREITTQHLVGNLSPEQRSRGLLEALLLGYRGNIDSSTYRAFRKTGLLHFISLSGMHLGILVGIIWWLCKTAGLMKRWRATICIIAIGIFLLIVPPRAPTLRAAIICWVFFVSFFFHRKSNPLNTLSLAAIILLLIRPMGIFEVGWQLSFASVLGIILFTDRIEGFLYEKATDWFRIKETQKAKGFLRIIPDPRSLFSIGLAAWLGSAGVLLYHFYTINPLTSLWTVITFPFVALILTIGYLKIVLSFLLPSVALTLGVVVNSLSDSLIWIVELIADLDISEILIGEVPLVVIVCYYGFILFAGFVRFRRPLIKKAICTTMVLALAAFIGITKWQRTNRENLIFTCLDVGHGQAILAQLPGKANILFDAGSLYKSDIGRKIVSPFLDFSGINKIDAIIISHNDVDHINGVPEIIDNCKVGNVYANDAFFSKADKWGTAKFLNERLSEKGFEIKKLKNLNLNSAAEIRILWPGERVSRDENLGDNDKSAVSLIEFAGRRILLCSDIEKFAQRELLKIFPNLKADIVVVPHHGSANTLDADFIERIEADILIYSCGQRQYERQQRNIEYRTRNAESRKLFYTPKDGAITIRINKDGTIKMGVFVR